MGELNGKIALVTGGTSGIGKEVVLAFLKEDAYVFFTGRDEAKGIELEKKVSSLGYHSKFIKCDVTKQEDIVNLKKSVLSEKNRLDILVNCAGIWETYTLENITYENYERIFKTNVASVIFMTQAFIKELEMANGNIVNISSIGGMQSHIAGKSQYLYASAKAAVIQFSQLCALNYAKKVRINCLCPGPTDTPIYLNRDFSKIEKDIPMGRLGMPDETAKAVLFLASSDSSYINGAVLTVDGGASIN